VEETKEIIVSQDFLSVLGGYVGTAAPAVRSSKARRLLHRDLETGSVLSSLR